MKYSKNITENDRAIVEQSLSGFVPKRIYDIHSHLYDSSHFPAGEWPFLSEYDALGIRESKKRILDYTPSKSIHGLYFGMPRINGNRKLINDFVASELDKDGSELCRGLLLTSPDDDPESLSTFLHTASFCGVKVYHCYANRPDTMNASITEYAPEWIWEILNDHHGVLMLHIVRENGISDEGNIRDLRRLCKRYPGVRVVLAHIARSFNYRTAFRGLDRVSDLDNIVVDTSAICESEAFIAAIKTLGPQRMLWGSDYPVSELRGRCITTGNQFFWLHPELLNFQNSLSAKDKMTLVGIESLLALKDACEAQGLTTEDINDIFYHNAVRFLKLEQKPADSPNLHSGPQLWQEARKIIAGGTGLMSKQAELYDRTSWPAYYTKSKGCEVWDMDGNRYIDFVGGIGSVLLGYADPDVNAAVQRRITMGSYSSLANPDEILLAQKLLDLHPWAKGGKVRFARTGGEAMSVAIRCARAYKGKSGIAFCGYHGWHDWYLAANLNESTALDGHLIPGLAPRGVPRELMGTSLPFVYNDVSSFDMAVEKLGDNLAAVVMEPMRSTYPNPPFIEHIVRTCREKSIVLIVDEITSGLRYGYPGAHPGINLIPDIVVYAKAMSNGIPFGTIIGTKEVMERSESSFISSSYWTDGIGTSAALAVLQKAERLDLQKRVWQKGISFQKKLSEIASGFQHCRVEVKGLPVTPSLTFYPAESGQLLKTVYIREMIQRGFLTSTFFYLMDAHLPEHLDLFTAAFEDVLRELDLLVATGNIHQVELQQENKEGFGRLN